MVAAAASDRSGRRLYFVSISGASSAAVGLFLSYQVLTTAELGVNGIRGPGLPVATTRAVHIRSSYGVSTWRSPPPYPSSVVRHSGRQR